MEYTDFIPQNVAVLGARRIVIRDSNGNRVGQMPLGPLTPPNPARMVYRIGAVADIHRQSLTAQEDHQRALAYFEQEEKVDFVAVAGDLTDSGAAEELEEYQRDIEIYSPNTPVYPLSGNHDGRNPNLVDDFKRILGRDLYYSFEHKGDVFIFVGCQPVKNSGDWPGSGSLFSTAELQWLYETLEANRNKRCFVFHHVRPQDGCGNAFGIYALDIWGGTEATVFESLMRHYKNAHQFHGHSHLKFYLQYGSDIANIDHIFGGWSIHIPSLAVPRDGDPSGASSRKEVYAESEGYVVDVYPDGIHLRGRDFVKGVFLPIASYWLPTPLQIVEGGTYTDPTGTIIT